MSRQASDLTLKGPNRGDGDSGNGTVRPSGRPKALLSVDEAAPFPVYKIGPFRIPTVAVQRLLNGEAPPRPAN
jgi:hypothetical protein